ncbi:hypothetical protein Q9233_009848 [Columba guinea]|nr:hypothetical protein Q9233_009848 [Columba guinea]
MSNFVISKVNFTDTHSEELLSARKVVIFIIETRCKNNTEGLIHTAYNKLITRRIIAKRETKCKLDEYISGDECCKKCERGFVKNVVCPTDTSEHCVPCTHGKDYMDHVNDLDKCLRCSSCDSIFGTSIEIATLAMTFLIQDLTENLHSNLNTG